MIVWLPTVSVDELIVATPPANATAPPIGMPLSLNCTDPAGIPVPGAIAATVAVNVPEAPNTEGPADDDCTVVLVPDGFTVMSAFAQTLS